MDERTHARYMSDIAYFLSKMEAEPNSGYFIPIALAYNKLEKYDETIAMCKSAIERFPANCAAKTFLAEAYVYKGQFDLARDLLFDVTAEDDNNYKALKLLGIICKEDGETTDALKYLTGAYIRSPEDEEVREMIEELGGSLNPAQIYDERMKRQSQSNADSEEDEELKTYQEIDNRIRSAEIIMADLVSDTTITSRGSNADSNNKATNNSNDLNNLNDLISDISSKSKDEELLSSSPDEFLPPVNKQEYIEEDTALEDFINTENDNTLENIENEENTEDAEDDSSNEEDDLLAALSEANSDEDDLISALSKEAEEESEESEESEEIDEALSNGENSEEITEDNTQEIIEEDIQGITEEDTQENIEDNTQESTEENTQENTEDNTQESTAENIQESIEENIEENKNTEKDMEEELIKETETLEEIKENTVEDMQVLQDNAETQEQIEQSDKEKEAQELYSRKIPSSVVGMTYDDMIDDDFQYGKIVDESYKEVDAPSVDLGESAPFTQGNIMEEILDAVGMTHEDMANNEEIDSPDKDKKLEKLENLLEKVKKQQG